MDVLYDLLAEVVVPVVEHVYQQNQQKLLYVELLVAVLG
jgi:hypothetical protein